MAWRGRTSSSSPALAGGLPTSVHTARFKLGFTLRRPPGEDGVRRTVLTLGVLEYHGASPPIVCLCSLHFQSAHIGSWTRRRGTRCRGPAASQRCSRLAPAGVRSVPSVHTSQPEVPSHQA